VTLVVAADYQTGNSLPNDLRGIVKSRTDVPSQFTIAFICCVSCYRTRVLLICFSIFTVFFLTEINYTCAVVVIAVAACYQ